MLHNNSLINYFWNYFHIYWLNHLIRPIIEPISMCPESYVVVPKSFVFVFNVSISLLQMLIYFSCCWENILCWMRLLKEQQQNKNEVSNYFLLQGNNSSTTNKVYICITLIYVNHIQNMRSFTGTKTYFIEIIICFRTLTFLFDLITKHSMVWLIDI